MTPFQRPLNILFTKGSDGRGHKESMLKRITLMIAAAALSAAALPGAAMAQPDHRQAHHANPYVDYRQAPPRAVPHRGSFAAPGFIDNGMISFPVQMAATAVSRSQAKAIAMRANRGAEYLDIKLSGGKVWLVRIMLNGQRFDVAVDAQSGRYLGRA